MKQPAIAPLQLRRPWVTGCFLTLAAVMLVGCASTAIEQAESLSRSGRYEEALAELDSALRRRPDDPGLRTAYSRQRERVITQASTQADLALAAGRTEQAQRLLDRLQTLDARHPDTLRLAGELQGLARQAAQRLGVQAAPLVSAPVVALGAAFQRQVTLEFRDAPLRQVFESLARSSSINFVFDREVRADTRVNVFLRAVALEEALRIILSTQQLASKTLNANTVLVYPNTAAKQREHQELVTRSLFLTNADVKQVLSMVRTMARTRDLHADERLNALIIRDSPQAVALIEQLVATIDLPEPEVTLAVEVLEIASDRLDALGLEWPTRIEYGLPGLESVVPLSAKGLRGSVLNPALALALRGNTGSTNLLANPTIRARNREKAKVQIGEKLPVFSTTTVTGASTAVSAAVTYLDVGLKLDVEPSVQLDNDVVIKVALEVSNLLRAVSGPSGTLAYQVGTRLTTTSLRLRDGETQVLAGLISDEDRQRAEGLPHLSELPLLGRLFGVRTDTRTKTEIVMLITPRIVRQITAPSARASTLAAGTEAQPGQPPLRLSDSARASVAAPRGGVAGPAPAAAPEVTTTPANEMLVLDMTRSAVVGDTVSLTLSNRSSQPAEGEVGWDVALLRSARSVAAPADQAGSAPAADAVTSLAPPDPGRYSFRLEPGGSTVVILRVQPAAAGRTLDITVSSSLAVQGSTQLIVAPARMPGGTP